LIEYVNEGGNMLLNESVKRKFDIFAEQIRLETLKEFKHIGSGHVGGAMSIVETLAVLYGGVMNIDPQNPRWEDRDWLIVSKGHSGPTVYAALALRGYFDVKELETLNQPNTNLPSHCDRNKTLGIDMTTGSLGQGISTAIGIALGNSLRKKQSFTYLIIGDGECDEGQIWEGALFAAHHQLGSLIGFLDANQKQLDGYTKDILDLGDLALKFKEFGWHTTEVDGSDTGAIHEAILKSKQVKHQPSMIILHTIKGKGCTYAENELFNHHMFIIPAQSEEAISVVKTRLKQLITEE